MQLQDSPEGTQIEDLAAKYKNLQEQKPIKIKKRSTIKITSLDGDQPDRSEKVVDEKKLKEKKS